jgi:hypothetical protein
MKQDMTAQDTGLEKCPIPIYTCQNVDGLEVTHKSITKELPV